jgi:glycosyltransferase involved in cell wall biosynthesis
MPTIGRASIKDAVKSLINQTDPHWNAIIIGDGVIPHPSLRHDPKRIIAISTSDPVGSAGLLRNYAIESVKTPWVAFLDDDDTVDHRYVEWLRYHYGCDPHADVFVFRMHHPKLGILPPLGSIDLKWGQVGISFAVRRECFEHVSFIREDLKNPGRYGNEDICLLSDLSEHGAEIFVSEDVAYYVGS